MGLHILPLALQPDTVHCGDARELLRRVTPESVALSFWSPPYFVGKSYEQTWSFQEWAALLSEVIALHLSVLVPGGFLAINIADILALPDSAMPRIQADNVATKRQGVTRAQILAAKVDHPDYNRYQLAALLGCSEQTIQRRTEHNNVRGGKYAVQRKVKLVGGLVQDWADEAGLYLYDRRVWVKDPCWENSRWHSLSYRSVDEFEYVYVFWKPGITTIDRARLSRREWADWGSRGVWNIASVRSNNEHEAQFPVELPRRVIRLFSAPGDLVLDPFIGSGTTALAAIQEQRHFLGFELVPEYAALAAARIKQHTQDRGAQTPE
ncbi:MAG: site-specific DNA-methyltransferase [Chloroflexi bacterium]|nr:site-specific DNA-methyltransferase [Chloroflexota bacterium]